MGPEWKDTVMGMRSAKGRMHLKRISRAGRSPAGTRSGTSTMEVATASVPGQSISMFLRSPSDLLTMCRRRRPSAPRNSTTAPSWTVSSAKRPALVRPLSRKLKRAVRTAPRDPDGTPRDATMLGLSPAAAAPNASSAPPMNPASSPPRPRMSSSSCAAGSASLPEDEDSSSGPTAPPLARLARPGVGAEAAGLSAATAAPSASFPHSSTSLAVLEVSLSLASRTDSRSSKAGMASSTRPLRSSDCALRLRYSTARCCSSSLSTVVWASKMGVSTWSSSASYKCCSLAYALRSRTRDSGATRSKCWCRATNCLDPDTVVASSASPVALSPAAGSCRRKPNSPRM
mmetsp:Transcript_8316/g.32787  ORF Transcript_8316/g.32787 Transcript_8316/m.32787 type:complete len:344 (+) Transcript_8316:492-1523(+)